MKHLRKMISLFMVLAMALCLSVPAFAAEEADADIDADVEDIIGSVLVDEADIIDMKPIDEIVLVDNADITVIVNGYTPMSLFGPAFQLSIANHTDTTLCYSMYDTSVNGFMVDPFWAARVSAGEEADSIVCWSVESLAESGINYIKDVETRLWVYDDEDYDADDIFNDMVTWSADTEGMEGEAVEAPEFDFTAIPLLDGEVSAQVVDFDAEENALTILVKNDSDKNVMVRAENVTVNSVECSPYWFEKLVPGKAVYSTCSWDDTSLKTAKVDSISTIGMKITVTDEDSYDMLASQDCVVVLPQD